MRQDHVVPTTSPAIRSSLTAAALLLLTACDGAAPEARSTAAPAPASSAGAPAPSSAAPRCPGARISFGPVTKEDVLTEVATAVTITSPSGGPLDAPMRPVRRYTAEVRATGDVPNSAVYAAFAGKVDHEVPLPHLGEAAPTDDDPMTMGGPGRFVRYGGVKAVKATFGYDCGGVTGRGVVASWLTPISGVMECEGKVKAPRTPMHDEARALGCGG